MEWIAVFNLVAPHVFQLIGGLKADHPEKTYEQVLREAGIELDAEHMRLLADMARAVEEGAVPHD